MFQLITTNSQRRDIPFQPFLTLCPNQFTVFVLDKEPAVSIVFSDQGDTACIGTDQLGCFGQNAVEEGMNSSEMFLEEVIDL